MAAPDWKPDILTASPPCTYPYGPLNRLRREQPFAPPNGPFENVPTLPFGFWTRPTREDVQRQQAETDRLWLAGDHAGARVSLARSARLIDELDHAEGAHRLHAPTFGACLPCDLEEAARLGAFLATVGP